MDGGRRHVAADGVQQRFVPDPGHRSTFPVSRLTAVDHVTVRRPGRLGRARRAGRKRQHGDGNQRDGDASGAHSGGSTTTTRLAATSSMVVSSPPGHLTRSSATSAYSPEPEVGSGILGGQVAAAGLNLACRARGRPASVRVTTAPGKNPSSATSSQCPRPPGSRAGPAGRRSCQRRCRGRRRCRSRRPPAAGEQRADIRRARRRGADVLEAHGRSLGDQAAVHLRAARRREPGRTMGMSPLATSRSRSVSRSRSTKATPQPVARRRSAPRSARTSVKDGVDGRRLLAREHGVDLAAGVGDEEVLPAVGVVVGTGHAHPALASATPGPCRHLLEAEAEPGRIGVGSARPRHVEVEAARVGVVGHVEVEVVIVVDIGEQAPRPYSKLTTSSPASTPTSRKVTPRRRPGPR